jgi:hypothetical protein
MRLSFLNNIYQEPVKVRTSATSFFCRPLYGCIWSKFLLCKNVNFKCSYIRSEFIFWKPSCLKHACILFRFVVWKKIKFVSESIQFKSEFVKNFALLRCGWPGARRRYQGEKRAAARRDGRGRGGGGAVCSALALAPLVRRPAESCVQRSPMWFLPQFSQSHFRLILNYSGRQGRGYFQTTY